MKILLGFAIILTAFLQLLLAQPTPVSDESANSKQNAGYAYILQQSKTLSDMIEYVFKRALPHIPKKTENEVYRDQLSEFLQLKSDYKEAELKEDCGEKANKLFDYQIIIFLYYLLGLSREPPVQEINKILDEYGMQKVRDYLDESRTVSATYQPKDHEKFNEYVIEHCKPSESN